jgi:Holliday junction resolvase RusA-like endonuclease
MVKKGQSYTYILKGEPEALVLRRSDDVIGWSNHKERKLITDISLESQHDDRPFLSGSLSFDVAFYFPVPTSIRAKIKAKQGEYHKTKPSIALLFNFLEHSAEGIIFADAESISKTSCVKLYDREPRTVITITELHDQKENDH